MYFCPAKIETDVTRLQETERDEKKKCYRIVTEIRNKPITLEKIDIGNQLLEKSIFENMERRFTKFFRRFIFSERRLGFDLLKIMRNRVLYS